MPFDMYGDVILTRDVHRARAACRRCRDGRGTARRAGVPEEGYSVEFFDMTGDTVRRGHAVGRACVCRRQPIVRLRVR